jgi:transposase
MKNQKETHQRYTQSFKVAAVLLANHPNIQTQDVALALDIHPFMLSRWKKEHREGTLKGKTIENVKRMEEKVLEQKQLRDMEKRIQRLERENSLLKKSMQYTSERDKTSTAS